MDALVARSTPVLDWAELLMLKHNKDVKYATQYIEEYVGSADCMDIHLDPIVSTSGKKRELSEARTPFSVTSMWNARAKSQMHGTWKP